MARKVGNTRQCMLTRGDAKGFQDISFVGRWGISRYDQWWLIGKVRRQWDSSRLLMHIF